MGDEGRAAVTHALVVAFEGLPELDDEPVDEELANLWKLGVHDSSHGCVYRGERQAGRLCFHDTPAEEASSADEILAEQLRDDVLDVRYVDFVDEAVDRFLQRLPGHSLVFLRCLVGDLSLQGPQFRGWNVGAA